jgi:molybdenum cofactor cytidylyltransferase
VVSGPERGPVAGVVLAAGVSSRLGRPKQLLDIHGETLIHRVCRIALESSLDEVIVVTGGAADQVQEALRDVPCRAVVNSRFAEGQATSFRAGLSAVGQETAAVVMLLGDQPQITSDTIDRVAGRWRQDHCAIVQAVYRGIPSHPVLFDRACFGELESVAGDEGARSVLRSHRNEIVLVEIDEDIPLDIDTDEDYQRLLASL